MLRTRLISGPRAGVVMSAVAAAVMTICSVGETLFEPLRVIPSEPAPVTLRLPMAVMRSEGADGAVRLQRLAPVVARGERVHSPRIAEYVRLYEEARRPVHLGTLVGTAFVYFLMAIMMTTYLRHFSLSYGTLLRTQVGLLSATVGFMFLAKLVLLTSEVSPYAIPVAALPLWVALYLDRRTAFMVGMAASFLCASLVHFRLDYLLTYLACSFTVTLAMGTRHRASDILLAGAAAAIAGPALVLASSMLLRGGISPRGDLAALWHSSLISGVVGGFLPGVLGLVFRSPIGRVLGAASRARLIDLTDLSQPLLVKMAREAPGSWEHARAMANLAEAAASAIGADGLLTRVGAYYHDLGKTCQAKYFIENLEAGEVSPHEGLDPDVSADAIMAHVVEGVRILREGNIPEPVVEFAYTHHGTSIIEFFWHKCLAQGNPRNLNEHFFRYPGMRPRTRETAILMLVDAIEAASRTVEHERDKFEEMVNRIMFVKLKQGQLDESGLSLEDLRIMSKRLTDTLCKMHHSRIRYPWQDAQDSRQTPLPIPDASSDDDVHKGVEEALGARTGR